MSTDLIQLEPGQLQSTLRSEHRKLRVCQNHIESLLAMEPWGYFSVADSSFDPRTSDAVVAQVGRGLRTFAESITTRRVGLRQLGFAPEIWGPLRKLRENADVLKEHLEALRALRHLDGSVVRHRFAHVDEQTGTIDDEFVITMPNRIGSQSTVTVRINCVRDSTKQTYIKHFVGDAATGPNLRLVYGDRRGAHLQPPRAFRDLLSDDHYHLEIPALGSPTTFQDYILTLRWRYLQHCADGRADAPQAHVDGAMASLAAG